MDLLYRAVSLERAKDGVVTATLSSENPILRSGYSEVLSHDPTSVVMTRAANGLPLLANHDPATLIGRVEGIRLQDRKLRGVLRPGNSLLAEQTFRDIIDGIVTDVSIGYVIHDHDPAISQGDQGPIYTFRKWEPYEVSTVSIGADVSAGIGRSARIEITNQGEKKMEPIETEKRRTVEILALAERHHCMELATEAIKAGDSVDAFKAKVLERMYKPVPIQTGEYTFGLGEKEARQYSFVRAINSAITKERCFETEISEEITRQRRKQPQGLWMPTNLGTRTLSKGTWSSGGALVETQYLAGSFIDILRAKSKLTILGAKTLAGLTGDIAIKTKTGSVTCFLLAESGAILASNLTFTQVALTPKTIGALTIFSRKLLLQGLPEIEALVRDDLARSVATGIDKAGIIGTGVANQPRGILNQSNIGHVALGVNGASPTWTAIVQLETTVGAADADAATCAYLTTSKARGALKTTPKVAAAPVYIWEDAAELGSGKMNGYRSEVSNNVPSNLEKGTGTGLSAIIFGDFGSLMIGEWGAVDILVNPYKYSESGDLEVRIFQDVDVGVTHPEAFVVITDCLAT